jgi:hypothetical protein
MPLPLLLRRAPPFTLVSVERAVPIAFAMSRLIELRVL